MTGAREVLGFISNFRGCEEAFTSGCCYWFAYILSGRFPEGQVVLAVQENHFLTRVGGRLYDVTGDVTELYAGSFVLAWSDMAAYDELQYGRLLRDCVYKST